MFLRSVPGSEHFGKTTSHPESEMGLLEKHVDKKHPTREDPFCDPKSGGVLFAATVTPHPTSQVVECTVEVGHSGKVTVYARQITFLNCFLK